MKWGLSSPILCSMLLLVTTMSCTVSMPLPVSPPAPPVSTIATVQPVETQISASLDEPIELRRGSIAFFADENLKIRYRVEIEWECPTPEPDQIIACEVPLLWDWWYEVEQSGESLGRFDWNREVTVGDYTIATTEMFSGYDYETHHFAITIVVTKQQEE